MPIRSSVTVSLVPEARGGPFVFWDDLPAACRKAKALGFDAVEVFPPSADAVDADELRTLLDDHGLALAAVGTGAGWLRRRLHLMPARRRRPRRGPRLHPVDHRLRRRRSARRRSSARCRGGAATRSTGTTALGLPRRRPRRPRARTPRTFGVPLLYEPLNRYETEPGQHASTAGVGAARVALDAERRAARRPVPHEHRGGRHRRRDPRGRGHGSATSTSSTRTAGPPGSGHLDFAPIAAALDEIGYDGYASAEALPYPDPDAAAEATIAAFRRYFRQAG